MSSDSSSPEPATLLDLEPSIITLASHLSQYLVHGPLHITKDFDQLTKDLIAYVNEHYVQTDKLEHITAGRPTRSQGSSSPQPPDWIISGRAAVNTDTRRFLAGTKPLLIHPPFQQYREEREREDKRTGIMAPTPSSPLGDPQSSDARAGSETTASIQRSQSRRAETIPLPPADNHQPQSELLAAIQLIRDMVDKMNTNQPRDKLPEFKAEDIGYFDPDIDKSYGEGSIVSVGKNTYYRDVYAFIDRLKDMEGQCSNLPRLVSTCLHGIALSWYTLELDSDYKTLLMDGSMKVWCNKLIARFKQPTSDALRQLEAEKYTFQDAAKGRSPRAFVQSIMYLGKAAEITTLHNLLITA